MDSGLGAGTNGLTDNSKQTVLKQADNDTLAEVFDFGLDRENYPEPAFATLNYRNEDALVNEIAYRFTNLWLKHKSHKQSDVTFAAIKVVADALQQIRPFDVDELRNFVRDSNVQRMSDIDSYVAPLDAISAEGLAKFLTYPAALGKAIPTNEQKAEHLEKTFYNKEIDIKTSRGLLDFLKLQETQFLLGGKLINTRHLLARNEIRTTLDSINNLVVDPDERHLANVLYEIEPLEHLLSMGGGLRAYKEKLEEKQKTNNDEQGKKFDPGSRPEFKFGYRVERTPPALNDWDAIKAARQVPVDAPHLANIYDTKLDFALAIQTAMPNDWLIDANARAQLYGDNVGDIQNKAFQAGVFLAERKMVRDALTGGTDPDTVIFCQLVEDKDGRKYWEPKPFIANQVGNTADFALTSQTYDAVAQRLTEFLEEGEHLKLNNKFTFEKPTGVANDKPISIKNQSIGIDSPTYMGTNAAGQPELMVNQRYAATARANSRPNEIMFWPSRESLVPRLDLAIRRKIPQYFNIVGKTILFGHGAVQIGFKEAVQSHPWVRKDDTTVVDPNNPTKKDLNNKGEGKMGIGNRATGIIITAAAAVAGAPVLATVTAIYTTVVAASSPKKAIARIGVALGYLPLGMFGFGAVKNAVVDAYEHTPQQTHSTLAWGLSELATNAGLKAAPAQQGERPPKPASSTQPAQDNQFDGASTETGTKWRGLAEVKVYDIKGPHSKKAAESLNAAQLAKTEIV